MTFLGWMHRKLTHNSIEPMKNSMLGHTCFSVQTLFDEKNYYTEPAKGLSLSSITYQKPSNRFESDKVEEHFHEEIFEPFEFLAIGTFGMELLNTDPPTPTLAVPHESLTNPQMEITENDIMLINYELEKFLEAEEKEIVDDTSGRSSQASIITLSNKPIEGKDSEGHTYFMACPLQNYLFANSIEVVDPDKAAKKEKTSLEELFKRTNIANDDPTKKSAVAEQPRKRSVAHFMKKVVKRFHSSSSTTFSKNEATVSTSMKKKLSKVLKMLHKKVHPEELNEKQYDNIQKRKMKDVPHKNAGKNGGNDEKEMVGQPASKRSEKSIRKLSPSGISSASTINGGHWINTDSDYLVLELQGQKQ